MKQKKLGFLILTLIVANAFGSLASASPEEDAAAITIQKHFRGYLARKGYKQRISQSTFDSTDRGFSNVVMVSEILEHLNLSSAYMMEDTCHSVKAIAKVFLPAKEDKYKASIVKNSRTSAEFDKAVADGNTRFIKFMLKNKFIPSCKHLEDALVQPNSSVVKLLLEGPNRPACDYQRLIRVEMSKVEMDKDDPKRVETINILLDKVNAQGTLIGSPLKEALYASGNLKLVESLLQRKTVVHRASDQDRYDDNSGILNKAVEIGPEMVRVLLQYLPEHSNETIQYDYQNTGGLFEWKSKAFNYALYKGNLDSARLLLDAGVNLRQEDTFHNGYRRSQLTHLLNRGSAQDISFAKELLRRGANVVDHHLFSAIPYLDEELIDLMLGRDYNVNSTDDQQLTPLGKVRLDLARFLDTGDSYVCDNEYVLKVSGDEIEFQDFKFKPEDQLSDVEKERKAKLIRIAKTMIKRGASVEKANHGPINVYHCGP